MLRTKSGWRLYHRARPHVYSVHNDRDVQRVMDPKHMRRMVADHFGYVVIWHGLYLTTMSTPPDDRGYRWQDDVRMRYFQELLKTNGFQIVHYYNVPNCLKVLGSGSAVLKLMLDQNLGDSDGLFLDNADFGGPWATMQYVTWLRREKPHWTLMEHRSLPIGSWGWVDHTGPWSSMMDYHQVGEQPNGKGNPPPASTTDPRLRYWASSPNSVGLLKIQFDGANQWADKLDELYPVLPEHNVTVRCSWWMLDDFERYYLPAWEKRKDEFQKAVLPD
jgi:hypothetical protein